MSCLQSYIHIIKKKNVMLSICFDHICLVPWCAGWCKSLRVFLQVWMCCPLRSGEWFDSSSFGDHGVAYQEDLEEGRPAGVHYSLRHEWLLRFSGRRIAKLRGGQKLDGVGLAWVAHIWVEGETVWVDFQILDVSIVFHNVQLCWMIDFLFEGQDVCKYRDGVAVRIGCSGQTQAVQMQREKPMQSDAHGQSIRYLRLRSRRFPVQSIPVLFLLLKLKHMRHAMYVNVIWYVFFWKCA